ncbi:hypothetical protein GCM10010232_29190 [Streptomyces amakusaensis]|uniref:DUF5709 domain-containing protein n=1 Tax=Streptomyces amakusaensis TaxID=67271 RepID=A0ABW0AET1_9ACTN
MAVDPTDPDIPYGFDESAGDGAGSGGESGETEALGTEVPEADAAEQRTEVNPEPDEPPAHIDLDTASEADAVEQARVVGLDEDDYR